MVIKPMQTVYQGGCHVESSIRNALKWTSYNLQGRIWVFVKSEVKDIVSVCVCVLCFPLLPFHVSIIYVITYIYCGPNAQAKTLKKFQHEVIASLHLSAMPPELFQYCEQLFLYLPLLLRPKLHFLHAYYMLIRHTCMPQDTTVPDAFTPWVMILFLILSLARS